MDPADPRHPRAVPARLPAELVRALAESPRARAAFEQLPPSHQREYVQWIAEARRDSTRERRAAQTVMRLLTPPTA